MYKTSVIVTLGCAFPAAGPPAAPACLGLVPGKCHHQPNKDQLLPSNPKWKQSWMIYASPTPPYPSITNISSEEA